MKMWLDNGGVERRWAGLGRIHKTTRLNNIKKLTDYILVMCVWVILRCLVGAEVLGIF